jgi:hypothetical protein
MLLVKDGIAQANAIRPTIAFEEFPQTTFDHCQFCAANIEECPRSVGEVIDPVARLGGVEVDQADQPSLVVDRVPGGDVAMAHNFSSSGQGRASGGVVEGGDHGANIPQRYLSGPDGGSLQERQDFAPLIVDAKQSGALRESMRLELAEKIVAELPASG